MKHAQAEHTPSRTGPASRPRSPTGGMRVNPPNTGIDFVDRTLRTAGPDAISPLPGTVRHEAALERDADRMAELALNRRVSPAPALVRDPSEAFLPSVSPNLFGSAGHALEQPVRGELEARFGRDFSRVRVHTDPRTAESADVLGAIAFTAGRDVGFAHGTFSPHSASGRSLLAHELAHTIQAEQGLAGDRVLRRRVPSSAHLATALPPAADTVGVMRARTGLTRVLARAYESLTPVQQTSVRTTAAGFGISFTTLAGLEVALRLAARSQLVAFANAVRTAEPARQLGDPALIDTGPRLGTTDAANIGTVVGHADTIFATIASGARDADLGEVFGPTNVIAAKAKYAAARTRMNTLRTANRIVTDRSGYNDEVNLGGLTNSSRISVHSSVIDLPNNDGSIITLIHESMHAGNGDVHDFGYIDQPSFTALPETVKLTNAAHFEVVPRRIRSMAYAFAGVTFIPAGATVGGVTAPALTPREQAIRGASEEFRFAWTAGLNLHSLFVHLFRNPTEWATVDLSTRYGGAPAGAHFSDTLPFWSKVEMLTMHTRLPSINPAGAPAVRPVTIIDVALSEGLVRKLAQGMNAVPRTAPAAATFEATHATAAERTAAAASVGAEQTLLIRLVIRAHLRSLTGDEGRDSRVVARLSHTARGVNFTEYLQVRPPTAFT